MAVLAVDHMGSYAPDQVPLQRRPRSRWYLTSLLVPKTARDSYERDPTNEGEMVAGRRRWPHAANPYPSRSYEPQSLPPIPPAWGRLLSRRTAVGPLTFARL